ncbi:MAG: KUP/HAK/KT family potassium transporter [Clostridia bacterium]|nr:KUP/HAK/KT family potassium transporter [Clostridia bacterium]
MENIEKKKKVSFAMFLVTIGIVYGDIGTSPLYVVKSLIEGNGGLGEIGEDFIVGALSLVIWTITLLTTIKYVLIAMKADNNGEGGIFSLYSLVRKCAKWLIIPAMIGGSALLADGVLTPAVTVTTAVEGLRSIPSIDQLLGTSEWSVVFIVLVIITVLFSMQSAGTSKIGKAFGPVMLLWFLFLFFTGLRNVFLNPLVLKAFNPVYAIKILFSDYNKLGFMILGSIFLAATGAEALYSDMGHVGRENIYMSWPFVKVCLITNYLGQGAWVLLNRTDSVLLTMDDPNPFFMMLPEALRPVAIILSAAAAVIASQALITGSYTLVAEAIRLDLMPHLKTEYPSETKGQIYISTVNSMLFIGCSAVVLYFRSGSRIESAYGLAITLTMLMTTLLLTVYLWEVKKKHVLAVLVCGVFGLIEIIFFISSLSKFTSGGYVTVFIAALLLFIMVIWHHGTKIEERCRIILNVRKYIDSLKRLKNDESIPEITSNLIYLVNSNDIETIDRDILYSILDRDPKRAKCYWLISIHITDEPDTANYEVETYGTDFIYRIRLNLGFKTNQSVNVYLRQIISELLETGEMSPQGRIHSIYGPSDVGTFKYCLIAKQIPDKNTIKGLDGFVLRVKYKIRNRIGSKSKWYGFDHFTQIREEVPLYISNSVAPTKLERIENVK